ncbi:MAG: nitroreductase family protein [Chloroflexia bacterium]|nr:nitroreductase family protein [Chloroflexia bacterium]
MEFEEVVRRRRMVRRFQQDKPVPREIIHELLQHALHAPSAGFSQGWGFLVLDEADDLGRFWKATKGDVNESVQTAPVVIVPLAHKQAYLDRYAEPDKGFPPNYEDRWRVPYWHIDTGMAALLILLGVVDNGLGALFFSMADATELKAEFGIPEPYDPVGGIALGYRAQDVPSPNLQRPRRPVEDVVHWGAWGNGEPS